MTPAAAVLPPRTKSSALRGVTAPSVVQYHPLPPPSPPVWICLLYVTTRSRVCLYPPFVYNKTSSRFVLPGARPTRQVLFHGKQK